MGNRQSDIRKQLGIAGRSEYPKLQKTKKAQPAASPAGLATEAAVHFSHSAQNGDRSAAAKRQAPAARPKGDPDLRTQVARAKEEIGRIDSGILLAEAEMELCARTRRKNLEWNESPEERLLRQKLAHLRLRRRALQRWLAKNAGAQAERDADTSVHQRSKGAKSSKRSQRKGLGKAKPRPDRITRSVSSGGVRRRATLIG